MIRNGTLINTREIATLLQSFRRSTKLTKVLSILFIYEVFAVDFSCESGTPFAYVLYSDIFNEYLLSAIYIRIKGSVYKKLFLCVGFFYPVG